jgi:hypothetical protein
VRVAFQNWVPRKECRPGCRVSYDGPDSANMTKPFPYVTRRIRVSADDKNFPLGEGEKSLAVENQEVRVLYMYAGKPCSQSS